MGPQAEAWIALLVIGSVLAMVCAKCTLDRPVESFPKLISITAVVSLTTVIGSSVSKCFGLLSGTSLYIAYAVYFVDGTVCMGATLLANAQCDVSIYIPAQLSSQLVINMVTGYLVWGDARYIQYPEAYLLVYVICVLAVYLISPEMDSFGAILRLRRLRQTSLSKNVAPTPLGAAMLRLTNTWSGPTYDANHASGSPAKGERGIALQEALLIGLETGAVTRQEMVSLVLKLLEGNSYAPTAPLIAWIQQIAHFQMYARQDPVFNDKLKGLLSAQEQQQLSLLLADGLSSQGDGLDVLVSLQAASDDHVSQPVT